MHRIEETIQRGICIGCGACEIASGGAVKVSMGPTRLYRADLQNASEHQIRRASMVCPFSDESPNEDALGAPQATDAAPDPHLGRYLSTFAGAVSDDEYRVGSSSGGLTSWLCNQLVERGLVDGVIRVGRDQSSSSGDALFTYIENDDVEAPDQRKSQYYAATLKDVLGLVISSRKRYALVGVPCFIRAARALALQDEHLQNSLVFYIGLVCGHYKTQAYAESLAWQLGIAPENLEDVDFRRKNLETTADNYDFAAKSKLETAWRSAPTRDLVGGNWGYNAFQPEACNFCDDVVGETADVSFGDAWLNSLVDNPLGTNIVINRNSEIQEIFDKGRASGDIATLSLGPDEVIRSQAGGFRHRRDGLAVRLSDDIADGLSVPQKRVSPDVSGSIPERRKQLVRHRRRMASSSHALFEHAVKHNDLDLYLDAERRLIRQYKRIESGPFMRKYRGAKRILKATLKRWKLL